MKSDKISKLTGWNAILLVCKLQNYHKNTPKTILERSPDLKEPIPDCSFFFSIEKDQWSNKLCIDWIKEHFIPVTVTVSIHESLSSVLNEMSSVVLKEIT